MLGIHTGKRVKAAIAVTAAGTLIGLGISPALAADPHAESAAQALDAAATEAAGEALLNQVFGPVLVSDPCVALWNGGANATPTGSCGNGLTLGAPVPVAYTQNAAAGAPAHSTADATMAPVGIPGIAAISLGNILDGLKAADTSDVLNALLPALGTNLGLAIDAVPGLRAQIDALLLTLTSGLDDQIDVNIGIGAVAAQCSADPGTASGNGTVTGIDGVLTLPAGNTIPLVIPVATAPNSKLVGSVPDLVDQIIAGIIASLAASGGPLEALLEPLATVLGTTTAAVVTPLVEALRPAFTALSDGLEPLVEGTVNEQVNGAGQGGTDDFEGVTPPDDGEITVRALNAVILQGTPLEGRLQLAKVNCGPNSDGSTIVDPGLKFDKDADADDGEAKFTLTVKNSNPTAANNVFVQDFYGKDIDKGDVDDVKATQGTFNKDTGRWDVGTLAAGATAKLTFKVDVDDDDLDDGITNAACVNQASKPGDIQKNKGVDDDTDGCDEAKAQKDAKDDDDDDGPKSVDSGLNDGGNLGALAITGLLAASTLIGSAARQRLLLDR